MTEQSAPGWFWMIFTANMALIFPLGIGRLVADEDWIEIALGLLVLTLLVIGLVRWKGRGSLTTHTTTFTSHVNGATFVVDGGINVAYVTAE